MNILLTEADYKDKYPPLGLMKIATFHKLNGDLVEYAREFKKEATNYYSKIYISTRFGFHWSKTKKLIKYYQKNYNAEIFIGGIHASINPNLYFDEFGIEPHVGSLKGDIRVILKKIQDDDNLKKIQDVLLVYGIDALPPDYSIFYNQELPFNKYLKENYFLRATKGCNRGCSFCDVKKICEGYIDKLPIKPILDYTAEHFGEKNNIIFFDDNTLLSNKLEEIIIELELADFKRGAKFQKKKRICDFNQGLDLRKLTKEKMQLLNKICIEPIRFAFDDIKMKDIYIRNIQKVVDSGLKNISVYVLYNYKDTPKDFYERLKISVMLNKEHGCRISSFPMKYIHNKKTDRKYIGKHWTKQMLRGVQCILNSSHGIVPVKYDFFEIAFGKNYEEFYEIINMPEDYIIHRKKNQDNIKKWKENFHIENK